VEDSGKSSTVTRSAEHRGETAKIDKPRLKPVQTPEGAGWEITCQASELVPVAQYANVTIGPIAVKRTVLDTGDLDDLKQAIKEVQEVIYDVIAEDREAVEESVRLHNQREAERAAQESKRPK
jgi:hypothetical protein